MNPGEFMVRLLIGGAIIVFGVFGWALAPYLAGAHIVGGEEKLYAPVMSVFFGTAAPQGYTVVSLLLARASFSAAFAFWILIPSLRFFADADFRPLARAMMIVFMSLSVAMFLMSLLVHIFYYGGGTLFA